VQRQLFWRLPFYGLYRLRRTSTAFAVRNEIALKSRQSEKRDATFTKKSATFGYANY
jgi:hypothetical protein